MKKLLINILSIFILLTAVSGLHADSFKKVYHRYRNTLVPLVNNENEIVTTGVFINSLGSIVVDWDSLVKQGKSADEKSLNDLKVLYKNKKYKYVILFKENAEANSLAIISINEKNTPYVKTGTFYTDNSKYNTSPELNILDKIMLLELSHDGESKKRTGYRAHIGYVTSTDKTGCIGNNIRLSTDDMPSNGPVFNKSGFVIGYSFINFDTSNGPRLDRVYVEQIKGIIRLFPFMFEYNYRQIEKKRGKLTLVKVKDTASYVINPEKKTPGQTMRINFKDYYALKLTENPSFGVWNPFGAARISKIDDVDFQMIQKSLKNNKASLVIFLNSIIKDSLVREVVNQYFKDRTE